MHGTLTVIENMIELSAAVGPFFESEKLFFLMGLEGLELGREHEEKLESIFGQLIGKGEGLVAGKVRVRGKISLLRRL